MLKVLEYHHLLAEIKTLIIDCYDNYAISVATGDYSNEPMIVGKGVLHLDCLRPLLFNMIVKTLKKSTDQKFVVWVIVLLRLYYYVTGFNLLIIRLSIALKCV